MEIKRDKAVALENFRTHLTNWVFSLPSRPDVEAGIEYVYSNDSRCGIELRLERKHAGSFHVLVKVPNAGHAAMLHVWATGAFDVSLRTVLTDGEVVDRCYIEMVNQLYQRWSRYWDDKEGELLGS